MAEDQNDAINHLDAYIKAPMQVHEVAHICRVDAMSDKLRNLLAPAPAKKETFKCEACNKEFPTQHALRIHNTKVHSQE